MIAYVKNQKELKLKDKIFNNIKYENISGKDIFSLPIQGSTKTKKTEKIINKLVTLFYEQNIKNVVLSNEIFENSVIKENLRNNNINVLAGNRLYNILVPKIIETICSYKNANMQNEKITFLVNENTEANLNNILEVSQMVKTVNIVTYFPHKFERIVNYLYEEMGILIRLSNNRKKDLLNSNIIINIDFNEELINKYYLNVKAIILNIPPNIKIFSKKFAGININSYNIIIPEEYKLEDFSDKYIYETTLLHKNVIEIKNKIKEVKIKNLIGKNGIINKKEFLSI